MLASTFLLAGSQALGILTAPGPRRGTKEELSFNPGEASDVIPYARGTNEIVPHLVTYFGYQNKKVKNDAAVEDILLTAGVDALAGYVAGGGTFGIAPTPPTAYTGMMIGGFSGAVVAGLGQLRTASYRHYCGFFYEIQHGVIDGISAVKIDERLSFAGTDSNAGNSILIDDPQAWGGDHVDGGTYWWCDIIPGNFWPLQQPNPHLVAMLGSSVPSYSGKACFVVYCPEGFRESGYFAANPGAAPALRPLKLRTHSYPNNLGVPEFRKVNTSGYNSDANIAECVYEWLTSRVFGVKGLSSARIDLDSFRAGAETHFNEGLGFSDQWNTRVDVDTALQTFSSLGDVVIYGGLRTGTIRYKLIRRDYSIPSLKVYRRGPDGSDPSLYNVIRVEGFTPGTWASTVNDFQFEYTDRDNNFIKTTRYAQDLANRMLTGKTRSLSQQLEGVSNGDSAALVGTREMRAGSFPRPPLTLVTNRDGFDEEPGNVIKYIDNVDNYTKVLRVAEVQTGTEDSSECHLVCVEDQYGVGAAAYSPFVPAGFTDPVGTAVVAANAKVIEAPYFLTRDDDPRLLVFAGKPNGAQLNFDTYVSTDGGTNYTQEGSRTDFAITGIITEAIERLTPAVLTSLTFTATNSFDATRLSSATPAQIAGGQNVLYFEDTGEFMAVEDITDNEDGTFTLENVWRAVHPFDSVPAPHAAGSRVWFITYGRLVTTAEYADPSTEKVKVLPRTVSAVLPLASAGAIDQTIVGRSVKPNPVRGVLVNSSYSVTIIGANDDIQIDWNETNRIIEGAVVDQQTAGVDPEDSTTYTTRFYATEGGGNVLLRTESAISAGTTTSTLTSAEEIASGGYLGHISTRYRVEIDVVRDGETSTTYIREIVRPEPAPTVSIAITVIAPNAIAGTASPVVPVVSIGITVIEPSVNATVSTSVPVASIGITVIEPDVTLGAPPVTTNVLAAQVLDWQPEESVADVSATPDILQIEVFN